MSSLPARLFAAWTTPTTWQTSQPIRRWRLTAGATVFGQAVFELLDPRMCLGQLLFQRQQFHDQRFEQAIFFTQGIEFFVFRHGVLSLVSSPKAESVGDPVGSHVSACSGAPTRGRPAPCTANVVCPRGMGAGTPGLVPGLESLPAFVLLTAERDHEKAGSGMLLMQLASGFSVGFATKALMMSCGHVLVGEFTPCPTPGNRKK